jgi:hypothetical protein
MSDLTYYECGPRGGYGGMEGVMHTVTYTYTLYTYYILQAYTGGEEVYYRTKEGEGVRYMG